MQKTLKNIILGACLALAPVLFSSRASAAQEFIRGDVDGDGKITLTDPINTLNYLFKGGAKPECEDAMDVSDDGKVDLGDVVYSLGYLFKGGSAPIAPFPDEGYDLTRDDLGCRGEGDLEARVIMQKDIPLLVTTGDTIYTIGEDIIASENAITFKGTNLIEDIIFNGNDHSITLSNSPSTIFYGENVKNILIKNVRIRDTADTIGANLVFFKDSQGVSIVSNSFDLFDGGENILFSNVKGGTIRTNDIKMYGNEFSRGIVLRDSSGIKVLDNSIFGGNELGENNYGAQLISSDYNSIVGNWFYMDGIDGDALRLVLSHFNTFEDNEALLKGLSSEGISLYDSWGNKGKRNSIDQQSWNGYGIFLSGTDFNPDRESNIFSEMTIKTSDRYSHGLMMGAGINNVVLRDSEIEVAQPDSDAVHFFYASQGQVDFYNVNFIRGEIKFEETPAEVHPVLRRYWPVTTHLSNAIDSRNGVLEVYDAGKRIVYKDDVEQNGINNLYILSSVNTPGKFTLLTPHRFVVPERNLEKVVEINRKMDIFFEE